MKLSREIIISFALTILVSTNLSATVSKINFSDFDVFKKSVQLNIIKPNNLNDINLADNDFNRANERQLNLIRN